jgi:hypothetical protein
MFQTLIRHAADIVATGCTLYLAWKGVVAAAVESGSDREFVARVGAVALMIAFNGWVIWS